MKPLMVFLLGCFVSIQGIAQIQSIEFFIDEQVPFGEAQKITIPPGTGNELSLADTLRFGSLAPGPHMLYLRAKKASGKWGIVYSKQFIVPGGSNTQPLEGFEYYLDSAGNVGTEVYNKFNATGSPISFNDTLRFHSVKPGMHFVYLRLKNTAGFWSMPYSRIFIVPGGSASEPIEGFEYFVDSITGNQRASYKKFKTSSVNIDISDTLQLTGLTNGIHRLRLSLKNTAGFRSIPYDHSFVNLNYGNPSKISSLVFYVKDTLGNQSSLLSYGLPVKSVLFESSQVFMNVTPGIMLAGKKYYICLRARDESGRYSFISTDSLRVSSGGTATTSVRNSGSVLFYPNPVSVAAQLKYENSVKYPIVIEIIDLTGKLIRKLTLENESSCLLDLSDLKEGTYILRCSNEEGFSDRIPFIKLPVN